MSKLHCAHTHRHHKHACCAIWRVEDVFSQRSIQKTHMCTHTNKQNAIKKRNALHTPYLQQSGLEEWGEQWGCLAPHQKS